MPPPNYRYYFPLQVRYADTDAQGHVFFGNYFTFLDEASGGYFRAIGFPWSRMQELGLDIYYVNAQCNYSGSATYEDMLHIYVRMARIGNTSFTIEGVIYKAGEDQPIASGQITSVVVNPQTRQPVPVPDELRRAVAAFEGETPPPET
ncbi:MAG: acyl-CoA thioesterase [Caldilineae bacterium]|nr:MAG: acyl-CoA thioesterase [Caldilineae bacterium]